MIGIVIVDDIVNAIQDFFRSFMITLDKIVYWFVEQVLQLIVDLANVNIFTDTTINAFARRIYVLLGLVMVFKLMISFIQILIDPDAMSDKEKGVGNVLKRVVISMALIVLVPSIFKMARDVQGYILPIIPKVVLGIDSGNNVTEPITEHNIGNVMAWYSFLPFFDYANEACAATGTIQKAVGGDMAVYEIYSVSTAADHINDKNSCNGGDYMYSHRYLISTLVGAYLLFTLVQVALNVAIRAIKFGICEFVAPIPIASYIDPKTSKSTFDKWVNTSIKVYLDLFIQLISIYFVVFVFMVVFKEDNIGAILGNVGNDMWRATLVILFIIVGLIKFVKEFPKFLSGLLGLKTDGALSSIFKGEGFKDIARTFAVPTGAALAATGNFINKRKNGGTVGQALRSAAAGGASATIHGGLAAFKGKGTKEVIQSGHARAIKARQNRELDKLNDVGFYDRMKVKTEDFLGLDSSASLSEGKLKAYDRQRNLVSTLKRNYNAALEKYADHIDVGASSAEAYTTFKELITNNQPNISSGNSLELKNILTKVQSGEKITYGDIMTARIAAQQSGSGGADIARALSDSSELMKGIQSKLWNSSTSGNIKDTKGKVFDKLDAHDISSAKLDSDIKNTFSQVRSAISEDIVQLNGDDKFGLGPSNQFNSETLFNVFKNDFKGFDDIVSAAQDKERTEVGTSKDAAARSSNSRRASNK